MEMNKRKIPFSPPDISELEIEEVAEALRSGWITTGPRTKELERRLAEYCHTSKVVCLNSATAAEELNLRVCGIQEGDEVIVPAYTYTASASAAIHCGAKVIFVDSQKDNCEMDYDKVAEAITEKTKAVVAVDLGGVICDYDKLYQAIESKKNLFTPRNDNTLGARIQKTLNMQEGKLTHEQIEMLKTLPMEEVGRKDNRWWSMYEEAKKYYLNFGNLNIPMDYLTSNGKKLSDWIIRQRRNYKLGKMPLEHKKKLDEIGFIWDLGNTWTNSTHTSATITY